MKLTKSLSFLCGGIIAFVIFLIKTIQSFGVGDYGADGKEFWMDEKYIVALVLSLIVIVYNAYTSYQAFTKKECNPVAFVASSITFTCLLSFYPLGVFFKQMNKGKAFQDYELYLYVGLIALAFFVGFFVSYFELTKKED